MAPVGEAVGYEAAIGGHHHPFHPCRVQPVLHQLVVRAVVLNTKQSSLLYTSKVIGGHHHPFHPCRVKLVLHQLVVRAVVLNTRRSSFFYISKVQETPPVYDSLFSPAFSVLADFLNSELFPLKRDKQRRSKTGLMA